MYRKHLIGIGILLLIFGSCLWFFKGGPLTSDKKLIEGFQNHKENFEKIAQMAKEDSEVMYIYKELVMLKGYNPWKGDQQKGFSNSRWNEYKKLFEELGSPLIHSVSKEENGLIQISSASIAVSPINSYESIVISKGYAYSLKEPSPLVDSLDNLGFENQKTCYKKIEENWYLFFDSGVSKPE